MAESRATVPDFTLQTDVDMEQAVVERAAIKAAAGEDDVVPSLNDLVVKACALALKEFPRANGGYKDGRFELYERVNVGVAVAAQDALVVPTVFDADRKTLREIAARDARARRPGARTGSITPPELSGGTFTVSNLGMYGVREFVAIINPPQAGLLSVGAVEQRPVVRDGEIVARHMMASRWPATTASSTAPTPRSSSPRSARASRRPSRWRSSQFLEAAARAGTDRRGRSSRSARGSGRGGCPAAAGRS